MKKRFLFGFPAAALILIASYIPICAFTPKDIVYDGGGRGKVVFKHSTHTTDANLSCRECHTAIFKPKKFADKITLQDLKSGKFCGACHNGTRAFSIDSCGRCHKNQ